jgi:hypothetical protein
MSAGQCSLPDEDRYVAMNFFLNANDFVSVDCCDAALPASRRGFGRFSRSMAACCAAVYAADQVSVKAEYCG